MRRLSVLLSIAFALGLSGVPASQANITPVDYPTPLSQSGGVSGDVVNIDPVNSMVHVRDATGIVQTIHVDEHVEILRRGEVVQLSNLSLDDFVTVRSK